MKKQQLYWVVRLCAVLAIVLGGAVAAVPHALAAPSPVRVPAGTEWVNSGTLA